MRFWLVKSGQAQTLRLSDRAWYCLSHTKPVYGHGPSYSRSSTTQRCHRANQFLRISSSQPRDLASSAGHYNTRAIIDSDMVQNNVVQGMPIDLSIVPPKCNHCILGKLACTPVPKCARDRRLPDGWKEYPLIFVGQCLLHPTLGVCIP